MLQAMRDGSKGIVAKIIVGLIILTFALFGIESIVALGGGEDAPAEVNGEEIGDRQVAQMIELQKRRLKAQFGENFDSSMISDSMLRKAAVESLINESLLKQAAAEGGIYFSDKEIDKLIVQSPEFQVGGVFDRDQYDLVLRSAGYTRSTHRELLRSNLTTQQAQSAWQLTSFATDNEENRSAQLDSQTRDFSYIQYSLATSKESVEVTPEEKQQYFTENSSQFMTQESVVIDYIELNKSEMLSDVEVNDEELEERYESIKSESLAKREFRAAHILLLEANAESRAVLADIQSKLSAGEGFEALAEQFSQDDSSKLAGGDLGFASSEVYEPEFADALIGLSKGKVSGVVQTRDGLHLIKLLDTRQPEVAEFADLKDSLAQEITSEKAQALYVERLEALNDEAFSASDLKEPAKSLGLTVKSTEEFTRAGGKGVASNNQVVQAAFSEGILYDDANSEVVELSDTVAIVLHLNTFKESVVKEFSAVETQVEALLRNKKGVEALNLKVNADLEKAKAGELASGWSELKGKTRNDESVDSAILASAFTMGKSVENASFNQLDLGSGDKAILRLDAINRIAAAQISEADEQKIERAKSFNEYKAYAQFFTEKASIERN
jgi:peptidyl-prolyl cis-trans isomerase D